jgi:hypothetical protein
MSGIQPSEIFTLPIVAARMKAREIRSISKGRIHSGRRELAAAS